MCAWRIVWLYHIFHIFPSMRDPESSVIIIISILLMLFRGARRLPDALGAKLHTSIRHVWWVSFASDASLHWKSVRSSDLLRLIKRAAVETASPQHCGFIKLRAGTGQITARNQVGCHFHFDFHFYCFLHIWLKWLDVLYSVGLNVESVGRMPSSALLNNGIKLINTDSSCFKTNPRLPPACLEFDSRVRPIISMQSRRFFTVTSGHF